jgi:hypothetical protein
VFKVLPIHTREIGLAERIEHGFRFNKTAVCFVELNQGLNGHHFKNACRSDTPETSEAALWIDLVQFDFSQLVRFGNDGHDDILSLSARRGIVTNDGHVAGNPFDLAKVVNLGSLPQESQRQQECEILLYLCRIRLCRWR